jgi:hypothetical protein
MLPDLKIPILTLSKQTPTQQLLTVFTYIIIHFGRFNNHVCLGIFATIMVVVMVI